MQELATNAWPSNFYVFQNGWIMRLSLGIHQRSNSVLPLYYVGSDLKKDISAVEIFYQNNSTKSRFQIAEYCAPVELDAVLDELGYQKVSPTLVMTITTEKLEQILSRFKTTYDRWYFSLSDDTETWFHKVSEFGEFSEAKMKEKHQIIKNIKRQKMFFQCKSNTEIIAVTLCVIENETMGIFEVSVKPSERRKGVGQGLMIYILRWAVNNNIVHIYLQVEESNSAAISLYNKLGFETCYSYHYREK
jgi:ribosomal protein S18 acetylase RimI-like enzyme